MHLYSIDDHSVNGEELKDRDNFIIYQNYRKWRRETTKVWEILLQWNDGLSSWDTLKDIKNYYPVYLEEYTN